MSKLLPCPFCGSSPTFPEAKYVFGTFYEAGCETCGLANVSVQISDELVTIKARESWDNKKLQYGIPYIEIVRQNAIKAWNTRASEWVSVEKEIAELKDVLHNGIKYDEENNQYILCWTEKQISEVRVKADKLYEKMRTSPALPEENE